MNNKKELLKSNEIFSSLAESELEAIARFSSFHSFVKGDPVFIDSEIRQEFCIVVEGELSVRKKQGDSPAVEIARIIKGESFGEIDLISGEPKAESAYAGSDTLLFIFPGRGISLSNFIDSEPDASSGILFKLISIIAGRIRSYNRMISEKAKWLDDIRFQLYTDKLTGLYNRTFLNEELGNSIKSVGGNAAVLMIKPDNFKVINDTYGHEAGDNVLRQMASLIRGNIGSTEIAARYRGDEFVVVVSVESCREHVNKAEEFRQIFAYLDTAEHTGGAIIPFSVSVGVSCYPDESSNAEELVKLSFSRVFLARASGGNRVTDNG